MLAALVLAGTVIVIKSQPAPPATPNLLDETFTDVVAGFSDADWTEATGAALSDPNSATCGAGAGWSGDCFRISGLSAFDSVRTYNTFAEQAGDVYISAVVKLSFTFTTAGDSAPVISIAPASDMAHGLALVAAMVATGTTRELQLRSCRAFDGFCSTLGVAYSYTDGSTFCIEMKHNANSEAWEWRINEILVDSDTTGASDSDSECDGVDDPACCTGTGTGTCDPSRVYLGAEVDGSGTESVDLQVDALQVGNNGWLGCP